MSVFNNKEVTAQVAAVENNTKDRDEGNAEGHSVQRNSPQEPSQAPFRSLYHISSALGDKYS